MRSILETHRRCWQTLAIAAVCIFVGAPRAVAAIEYVDTLSNAELMAARLQKPIVLEFGASWCGWCRKLESQTLADKRVAAEAAKFLWVKIDIDEKPDLAATYHVRGVPHTVVINAKGQTLAEQVGFVAADGFLAFLQSGLDAEAQQQIAAGDDGDQKPADLSQTLTTLVEGLSKSERGGRDQLLEAISQCGPVAWPVLEKLMNDQRLAIRAAAAGALGKMTHAGLMFDPFADQAQRQRQLALWHDWIQQHAPAPAATPENQKAPEQGDKPAVGESGHQEGP